jgi:hypothetical protein
MKSATQDAKRAPPQAMQTKENSLNLTFSDLIVATSNNKMIFNIKIKSVVVTKKSHLSIFQLKQLTLPLNDVSDYLFVYHETRMRLYLDLQF